MSPRRVACLLGLLLLACGRDDGRPARVRPHGTGGSAGASSAGGGGGALGGAAGTSAGGGASGSGGAAGAAGSGGAAGASTCGNGVVEASESCDGAHLAGQSCEGLGYDGGTLSCAPGCVFDESGCFGTERCTDGLDNDHDGKVDCDDGDCSPACSDPCAAPPVVDDPGVVKGTTAGHPSKLDASCSGSPSGGEVVYLFTPKHTGYLEAWLASSKPLTLAVRSSCGAAGADLACDTERVKTKVVAGQPLYLLIEGHDPGNAGGFSLTVSSRSVTCGDGHRDEPESCDDGNVLSGDGCSASCALESTELEPNSTPAQASSLGTPHFAEIAPAGDVDWVKIVIGAQQAPAAVVVDTFDLGDGACTKGELDSELGLFASDGTTLLASDDDGGSGTCAHLLASGLSAGNYFVRVTASSQGSTPTFPYRLAVSVQ